MNATVNIICYKQKTLRNGQHPLMIRITKNGKIKYKSLGISVHPDHWDYKTNKPKPKCPNKELILKTILEKEAEFQKEILELMSIQKGYTASSLIAAKTNQVKAKTVEEFYNELIKHYQETDKLGNARTYKYSLGSIIRFCGKAGMLFSDIDVSWLKKYEQWLINCNCTEVTISFIFRTLRSAYNKAIEAKCAFKNNYPFTEFKVSKFDVSTQKRAIPKEAIKKVMAVDYVARHSFATVLKNSGVNIALISETLGHKDIATTQIYLDSFEDNQIDEAMKNLL